MASSGLQKWEKYFINGAETVTKTEVAFLDSDKNIIKTINKGTKIQVVGGAYNTNAEIIVNNIKGFIKFSAIEKPIHLKKTIKFDLKPDKIGLSDEIPMQKYSLILKELVDGHSELSVEVKLYLISLIMNAEKNTEIVNFDKISSDLLLINSINKDFLETLGPIIAANQNAEFKKGVVFFPKAGNEPLYDFKINTFKNQNFFSSKRSSGSTNTLKANLILDKCANVKGFKKELELFKLIKDTKVKDASNAINIWLANNFANYSKREIAYSNEDIVRLEYSVVDFINNSTLNFLPLIKKAIPDLWYVKAQICKYGILQTKPLIKGKQIQKVVLRSKSSPNHISDKLGFQI